MTKLEYYISLAARGTRKDVELILKDLNSEMTLADSKFIDYALGLVTSSEGVETIRTCVFTGNQMQRNYCSLFFNRRCEKGDWETVKKAYKMGLIDERQAFSK